MKETIIEQTWGRLLQQAREIGCTDATIINMRLAFTAGLYAASAAITVERVDARTISETAFRVEQQ